MNSQQYEEFCRCFLAEKFGVHIETIKSVDVPNPAHPGLPQYKHQIDLYWETRTQLCVYLHIANAKWRAQDKVDQPEVLLLQQVKLKVAAHKALMFTTQGYTAGAIAAAKDEGIALHIVRPNIDVTCLPTQGRNAIQAKLKEIASSSSQPVFLHEVVHRAFDLSDVAPRDHSPVASATTPGHAARVESGSQTRSGSAQSHRDTSSTGPAGGESGTARPTTERGKSVNRRG